MKIFKTIFEKDNGGKVWTSNVDEYAELMKSFDEAVK